MTPRPNLFVVGAMRAGTTALHRHLAGHRDVFMCPVKEPNYFARRDGPGWMSGMTGEELDRYLEGPMPPRHNALVRCWDDYLRLFRDAGGVSVVGEASPSYLYSAHAPEEIDERCPDARAVVVLRDPVARAVSHHQMEVAIGREDRSFVEALGSPDLGHPYLDGSRYADRVARYLEVLGAGRVHVYLYDDYRDRPRGVLDELAASCGIDPGEFGIAPEDEEAAVNPGLEPRSRGLNLVLGRTGAKAWIRRLLPRRALEAGKRVWYGRSTGEMLPEALDRELAELFRPDVERLAELLGRDLSPWLRR